MGTTETVIYEVLMEGAEKIRRVHREKMSQEGRLTR